MNSGKKIRRAKCNCLSCAIEEIWNTGECLSFVFPGLHSISHLIVDCTNVYGIISVTDCGTGYSPARLLRANYPSMTWS